MKYLCLLRGVNVGGKNKVSMAELKEKLIAAGFDEVSSYINSGNIFVTSDEAVDTVARKVEAVITDSFKLDSELIKVVALTTAQLRDIVKKAPKGFGSKPNTYHSDVLFPMDTTSKEIIAATELRDGVDASREANGVVYYQRLSAERTKSKLGKVIAKPIYKSITIRSWQTTLKLHALLSG